ncbi:MAG: tetratricopeptide repeat protein, partial [Oscillatoria sp. PMC 1050.18]|nr:tetratricopeptide repeat protein [Oscillatoria sp. PMC 1050.18]
NQALQINPKDADAYYNRGNAKFDQGNLDGAIADYNQALQINPKDADAYYNRGVAKRNQGDIKGAREDYQKAEKIFCSQGSPYCQTAQDNLKKLQQ